MTIGGSLTSVNTDEGNITVEGDSDVKTSGVKCGLEIRTKGGFYLDSGSVTAEGNNGISASGGVSLTSGTTLTATGDTLALNANVNLSSYTDPDPTVRVNTEKTASGAKKWNGTDDLGSGGSFKYVKIMPKVETYTVTWQNYDGTVLEKDEDVVSGATPEYNGATPEKDPDAQYTYTFKGWNTDPSTVTVTEDITFKATYTETKRSYEITWKNGDTDLKTELVEYGVTPAYTGEEPTIEGTADKAYKFAGWDPEIVPVTADATYTAKFDEITLYNLWVGGVQANSENKGNILGDTGEPSAVFNSGTNTLTLNNLTYSGKGYEYNENGSQAAVCYLGTETLNLVISGTNSVTQTGVTAENAFSFGFYSEGPVTFAGTGVLNVSGGSYGIFAGNDIIITGCEVTAKGETAGIYSKKDLTISGASAVNADAATFCFYSEGNMNIRDSGVTASGTWETGQYCGFQAEGNMEITDSKVNATGHFLGMRIMGESLEISGANTVVTADGTNTAIEAKNGKIEISDGAKVNATGVLGGGIYAQKDITISDDDTVVTADGKASAITVKNGKITISSPLGIFEPAGGILDDAKQNICTFDGKVSPHAVIKQFDPTAPGMTHTVKWINDDGTVLETDTDVPYGSLPTYDGATPTKEASGGKTYTFKGWTPDVVPVSADATYTATYDESSEGGTSGGGSGTDGKYIITWIIDGKSETEEYAYGETPTHTTPKKDSDVLYEYTFTGWTPEIEKVTKDATYTAEFDASVSPFSPFSPFGPLSPLSPLGPGSGGSGGSGSGSGTTDGTGSTGGVTLPFTDVSPDSPFYDDIAYVYENDIMNGMSDTEFGENLPLTRGMIVTILWRVEGRPEVTYTGAFTDVPDGMWYTDGVEWAASHGIVLGYGDGRYGPDDSVTREQLAAILHRYAKYKGYDVSIGEDTNILSYNDAFTWGDWAVPALQWACGAGVLEDVPAGMLRPTEAASRGEIAHAIHRFMEDVAK